VHGHHRAVGPVVTCVERISRSAGRVVAVGDNPQGFCRSYLAAGLTDSESSMETGCDNGRFGKSRASTYSDLRQGQRHLQREGHKDPRSLPSPLAVTCRTPPNGLGTSEQQRRQVLGRDVWLLVYLGVSEFSDWGRV
jgi:hypothetical protein